MTTTQSPTSSLASVTVWTAGVAIVWIVAAILRPETTLHLGPIFLPLIPAFLLRGTPDALKGVLTGVAIGAVTIAVLTLTGNMSGPPLEPFQDPLTESIVFLAGSAIVGLLVARIGGGIRRKPTT
jgi:hypothetical protein